MLALILSLLLMAVGAWGANRFIEARYQAKLQDSLQTVLGGVVQALSVWSTDRRIDAAVQADSAVVTQAVEQLLKTRRDRALLLASPGLQRLREHYGKSIDTSLYRGFFVIGPGNVNLASSRNENVGAVNLLIEQPDVLAQLWSGRRVISRIQESDVPLSGRQSSGHATFFAGAPIRNGEGEVIALLTLRLDPYLSFFPILARGRIGDTGETYAFDRQGMMLSPSAYEPALVERGWLRPGEGAALNLRLADPGPEGEDFGVHPSLPLTRMARNAVAGGSGSDMAGYRDYRGIPVVGVWQWNDELSIGIGAEQDVDEAYYLLNLIKGLIYGGGGIAGLILVALFGVFTYERRATDRSERKMAAILDTANDGIVLIDSRGIINKVNPATERMFGYPARAMVGQNIKLLMPEPYHSEHDGYLRAYRESGAAKVIGSGRVLEGRRMDGSHFPIELSVNRLELDTGLFFAGVIHDESERSQALRELTRFKTTLDQTLDCVFMFEPDSLRFLYVNQGAIDQVGYSREELMGMTPVDIKPHFTEEVFRQTIAPLLAGEVPSLNFETEHEHKSGARTPVEIALQYVAPENEPPRLVAVVRNITQRREADAALRRAKEEAEAANRAKSTFLAVMSHEIRTPLNGIVSTIDMLSRGGLDERQLDLVETAKESSQTLVGIIDDILDFSKIEAGRLVLEQRPLLLEGVLESVGEGLRSNASRLGVDLLLFADPLLEQVTGDPTRIKQILFNLTGNAIKFSANLAGRKGEVLAAIERRGENDDGVAVAIRVVDNGIGMTPEVLGRIFEPFVQGEEQTTRRYGGTGLGLVITRRLVDMMGGTLTVESDEGAGTRFTVGLTLPKASGWKMPPGHDLSGVSVLLVRCGPVVERIVTRYLEPAGATILPVTAADALACFRERDLSGAETVVVIDSPEEGAQAEALIERLGGEGDNAPRFLVGCRGDRRGVRVEDEDIATLDFNALRRATLVNAVAVLVGRDSPELLEPVGAAAVVLPQRSLEEARAAGLVALVVDDNPINRKTIGQQLNMLGYAVDTAEDGEEALALWRAGRYPVVLTDCHMPRMDGYSLARAIRAEEGAGRRTPIVAITADAVKGTSERCFAAGMDGYLTKPMQLHELQAVLAKWLPDGRTGEPAEPVAAGDGAAVPDAESVVDPDALKGILGIDDPEMLRDFYREFLASGAETVEALRAARVGGDLAEVGGLAHKLKSSANTVGAFPLGACCLELERAGKAGDRAGVDERMGRLLECYGKVEGWIDQFLSSTGA
ncbi:PAS domain S-box protein [Endothiovibrio diazotrophicus]